MNLTAPEIGELLKGSLGILIRGRAHGKGDQNLVCVDTWVEAG